jgi:secondary thiamine-phosphate synthase enzyme
MHTTLKPKRSLAKNSKQWISYFETNRATLLAIPWDSEYKLTLSERGAVTESLRIFQLGETSEGKRLRKLVARHALRSGNPRFERAMDLFIQEEQRHARDLGRFLLQQSIPQRQFHWSDLIFRSLRGFFNLETCLTMLLTAELVAKSYYRALRRATASPVLRQICTQLLKDEVQHLYFHSQNLAAIQSNRTPFSGGMWEKSYRCFFVATLLAVWAGHRKVFRAAGMDFRDFHRQAQENADRALGNIAKLRYYNHKQPKPFTIYRKQIQLQTKEPMQFLDITDVLLDATKAAKIETGIAYIQTQHTTTGLMINENEPLLLQDMRRILSRIAPDDENYGHNDFSIRTVNLQPFEDKNGHAHCRALFLRSSESVNIVEGIPLFGRWQRLFFIECDRPKTRTIQIMILGSSR